MVLQTALQDRRSLRSELAHKKDKSIWQMSKDQLVEQAVQKLGWRRAQAEAETKSQLQLHLKEYAAMAAQEPLLPKGWKRFPTIELQRLMRERGLDPGLKKNQEMVRELSLWGQAQQAAGLTQVDYDVMMQVQMGLSDVSSSGASASFQALSAGSAPSVPVNSLQSHSLTELLTLQEQIRQATMQGWTHARMMEWFHQDGTVDRYGQDVLIRLLETTNQ